MTIFPLCLLFMSWAQDGEHAIIASRAPSVAFASREATRILGPVFDGEDGVDATEMLLERMTYLESRGDHKALSPDGAVGIIQIQSPSKALHDFIVSSPTAGMIVGLHMLHAFKKKCGGKAIRWIGGYASGRCGGAPSVARERCGPLGLCDRL